MAKVVDITEKLAFDNNPKIKIKDKEFEVNTDAEVVLKLMGQFGKNGELSPSAIVNIYNLIFSEADRDEISKLKLKFNDFKALINEATDLIIGGEEGE